MTTKTAGFANFAYQTKISLVGALLAATFISEPIRDGSLAQIDHPQAFVVLAFLILVLESHVLPVGPDGQESISLSTPLILTMLFVWSLAQTWLVIALVLTVVVPGTWRQRHRPTADPWTLVFRKLAFNAAMLAIALSAAELVWHTLAPRTWFTPAVLAGGIAFTGSTWLLCAVGAARRSTRPLRDILNDTWRLEALAGLLQVAIVPSAVRATQADPAFALGTLGSIGAVLVGTRLLLARRAEAKHAATQQADAEPPGTPSQAVTPDGATPSAGSALLGEQPGQGAHLDRPTTNSNSKSSSSNAATRSILLLDIERYSPRPDQIKARLRAQLRRLVIDAITAAGITPDQHGPLRDEGDGLCVLFEPHVPRNLLVHPLVTELASALRAYNAAADEREQMRLRVVVDAGDLRCDGDGYFGAALDDAYSLINAEELRSCLRQTDGPLILVVSPELYEGIVRQEYDGIDPGTYEQLCVRLKHHTLDVWIHTPGR